MQLTRDLFAIAKLLLLFSSYPYMLFKLLLFYLSPVVTDKVCTTSY